MPLFKKILVPVDGSEPSDAAVALAIRLASDQHATLIFLHVSEVAKISAMVSTTAMCADPSAALDAELAFGKESLLRAEAAARQGAVVAVALLDEGNSSETILDATIQNAADLIVIGSHGRGGIQRVLLGSVTEAVLRHSNVPVLVTRVP
jgi:nucleotide-binding universal stress UspA family protein